MDHHKSHEKKKNVLGQIWHDISRLKTAKYVSIWGTYKYLWGKEEKIGFDVNMQNIEVHKWNMLSMKNAK